VIFILVFRPVLHEDTDVVRDAAARGAMAGLLYRSCERCANFFSVPDFLFTKGVAKSIR
jgi:hypothetical protein